MSRGPRDPGSLRHRVALTALVVLSVWVAVLTVAFNLVVASRLRAQADDVLRSRAEAAAATVEVTGSGTVSIRDVRSDAAIDVGTWIFAGSQEIEGPPGAGSASAQAATLAGVGNRTEQVGGRAGVLWYAEPVLHRGRQVATVVTSLPLAPYRSTEELTLVGSAAFAVLLLGAVYLALRLAVGRALRPVNEMTHQAARWSEDDVEQRFGDQRLPAELDDLAATLDRLLDRLSSVLHHERRLSAEVSHELRTPLARVLAEVELLRTDVSHQPAGPALDSIRASVVEATEILETLMSAARSGYAEDPGRCEVAGAVRAVIAARRQDRVPVLARTPTAVYAGVDAAVLARALGPVLDNAVRYATSRVVVTVLAVRGLVRIGVADDGPGFEGGDLVAVFEPGHRRSDDSHQGAGLGLALSRRLITTSGGTIVATNDDTGARVTLNLPAG